MSSNDRSEPALPREVMRLPRVRRLGYLRELLAAIGANGCTKDHAQGAVLEVVKSLDAAKAAALGRRVPKLPKGDQLVEQCIQLASRLGLLTRHGPQLNLTATGAELLTAGPGNDLPVLFQMLYRTFPLFRRLVTVICERPEGYRLPQSRASGLFTSIAKEQGLDLDQITFEVARDLATEFLVVNWRPPSDTDGGYLTVYATGRSCLDTTSMDDRTIREMPTQNHATGCAEYTTPIYAVEETARGWWTFVGNVVRIPDFEQALWRNYLHMTDRIPRFPVLYPELRDSVCETLRIPDAEFDASLMELLRCPSRLEIYPAEGVLNYASSASITYKHIPPRTPAGQFMTFLKIDSRGL